MAITTHETQVTWSANASVTVSSATPVDSDVFTLADNCIAASIQLYADNQGTPASGDTAVFRIKWSSGDILGNTGDDFDTSEHAQYVGMLDTVAANTPGEDPAMRTFYIELGGARKFKLSAVCAQAASRNIVLRARVVEQRAA